LKPEVTGALVVTVTTAANIAAMMNFFMSASITHRERFCCLAKPSAVLARAL
jgi:hypothetical protein